MSLSFGLNPSLIFLKLYLHHPWPFSSEKLPWLKAKFPWVYCLRSGEWHNIIFYIRKVNDFHCRQSVYSNNKNKQIVHLQFHIYLIHFKSLLDVYILFIFSISYVKKSHIVEILSNREEWFYIFMSTFVIYKQLYWEIIDKK